MISKKFKIIPKKCIKNNPGDLGGRDGQVCVGSPRAPKVVQNSTLGHLILVTRA